MVSTHTADIGGANNYNPQQDSYERRKSNQLSLQKSYAYNQVTGKRKPDMLHGLERAQGISPKFTANRCVTFGMNATPRAALIGAQNKSSDRTTIVNSIVANASSINRISGESWDAEESH